MDAKTKDAFNDVRKLAKYFESLGRVVETFDAIEQAEAIVGENEARVAKLRDQAAEIAAANETARSLADEIVAKARAQAEEIVQGANASAETTRLTADADAAVTRGTAEKAADAAKAKAKTAEDRAKVLDAAVEAKKVELADIEARVAEVRKQAEKLLG